jgi:hypothetical protein
MLKVSGILIELVAETLRWLRLAFRMIPLSEFHLRFTRESWIAHYNGGRPHMSLGPGLPSSPAIASVRPEPSSRRVIYYPQRINSRRTAS